MTTLCMQHTALLEVRSNMEEATTRTNRQCVQMDYTMAYKIKEKKINKHYSTNKKKAQLFASDDQQ